MRKVETEYLHANATRGGADAFLQKSIQTVASVLLVFRRMGSARPTKTGDAALRVSSVVLAALLLSLSRGLSFVAVYGTIFLAILATRKAATIVGVLKSAGVAGFLSLAILLPSMVLGNALNGALICAKTLCTVASVALLASETRADRLFEALTLFRIPASVVLILDISLRYIVLLGEYTLNLLFAIKVRSVGQNRRKRATLSGAAGTLFLRSMEASRELHQAMECRGFSGTYAAGRRAEFGIETLVLMGGDLLLLGIFVAVGR